MTSSQPVVTQNAINFTPDNKRAYAYSGDFTFTDSVAYGLDFVTNTEYLVATVYFGYHSPSGNNIETHILFNDQIVFQAESNNSYTGDFQNGFPHVKILIPPFTHVQMGAINVSASDARTCTIALSADAFGMIETGYQ